VATHADFDHLLGPLAFPGAPLGVGDTTAARLRAAAGQAQRDLRAFDAEHYVERLRPLSLGAPQVLPVPGTCDLGDRQLVLVPAEGHTADGLAVWVPHARVLVCGDYLSPVELPTIGAGGGVEAYRATLERLAERLGEADHVVPGHGRPLSPEAARRLLDEDRGYLERLAAGDPRPRLPPGRATARQRRLHGENLAALARTRV
jgi:glyoxylase-like metal-dependent hydrolase (beta-lactamase superfamily II)